MIPCTDFPFLQHIMLTFLFNYTPELLALILLISKQHLGFQNNMCHFAFPYIELYLQSQGLFIFVNLEVFFLNLSFIESLYFFMPKFLFAFFVWKRFQFLKKDFLIGAASLTWLINYSRVLLVVPFLIYTFYLNFYYK